MSAIKPTPMVFSGRITISSSWLASPRVHGNPRSTKSRKAKTAISDRQDAQRGQGGAQPAPDSFGTHDLERLDAQVTNAAAETPLDQRIEPARQPDHQHHHRRQHHRGPCAVETVAGQDVGPAIPPVILDRLADPIAVGVGDGRARHLLDARVRIDYRHHAPLPRHDRRISVRLDHLQRVGRHCRITGEGLDAIRDGGGALRRRKTRHAAHAEQDAAVDFDRRGHKPGIRMVVHRCRRRVLRRNGTGGGCNQRREQQQESQPMDDHGRTVPKKYPGRRGGTSGRPDRQGGPKFKA